MSSSRYTEAVIPLAYSQHSPNVGGLSACPFIAAQFAQIYLQNRKVDKRMNNAFKMKIPEDLKKEEHPMVEEVLAKMVESKEIILDARVTFSYLSKMNGNCSMKDIFTEKKGCFAAVVVIGGTTFCVCRDREKYWIIDSHAGEFSSEDVRAKKAAAGRFGTLEKMIRFMENHYPRNVEQMDIYFVELVGKPKKAVSPLRNPSEKDIESIVKAMGFQKISQFRQFYLDRVDGGRGILKEELSLADINEMIATISLKY